MRTAGHVVERDLQAVEDHDTWAALHHELDQLPKSFREPLILCYLDGLTQEQAAAQLHCPLGTIQSRLSRGRAKLKARFEKRGVSFSGMFAAAGQSSFSEQPSLAGVGRDNGAAGNAVRTGQRSRNRWRGHGVARAG